MGAKPNKLPRYSNILNPIDGSLASQQATLHAIALAKVFGAKVRAVHVLDDSAVRQAELNVELAMDQLRQRGTELLSDAEQRAESEGVKVETLLLEGRPGETIVKLAERGDIDLIVMGATGYRDVAHLLARLGSVSEYVIKSAPCPVLVVRAS